MIYVLQIKYTSTYLHIYRHMSHNWLYFKYKIFILCKGKYFPGSDQRIKKGDDMAYCFQRQKMGFLFLIGPEIFMWFLENEIKFQ